MQICEINLPDQMQFTSSPNTIDQYLWSSSNAASSPANQSNQLLMKFWNNSKQQPGGQKASMPSNTIGRNSKIGSQPIASFNQNNCDEATNEPSELDAIKEVHSPHRDHRDHRNYKQANSGSNNVNIVHQSAPIDFGCDDTYEDGIDKDMRDLERRLESELEEHEKLWSPDEETPISQT